MDFLHEKNAGSLSASSTTYLKYTDPLRVRSVMNWFRTCRSVWLEWNIFPFISISVSTLGLSIMQNQGYFYSYMQKEIALNCHCRMCQKSSEVQWKTSSRQNLFLILFSSSHVCKASLGFLQFCVKELISAFLCLASIGSLCTYRFEYIASLITFKIQGAAGVVVSCKIPILATRVRFPGGAFIVWTSKRFTIKNFFCIGRNIF